MPMPEQLAAIGGQMDSAKAAGLIVVGAVAVLALLRRGFGSVNIRVS